ncbi:hypothetical protein VOLCADRAFT_106693 [Volvox carteri f. nagariensis]|uniref:Rieske-like [2Fe-2S] domain-containing protein n=1 Tax=Volvox carteri f. nagariensis TaxID=3068 RepID=D8U950_VOLCA|nr:uncharacterized protein VOLCADRAFT_106693 [Volvox carteri f. nagariensis]EFJ43689.1 hypothetical protein VOLCADRAFT_106693 [Volvox carteri f. nagariensis]|eukprot:XP_002955170.1 hypothetical protein VOLCADRAFT_106693 [Volvox carteri f. nagariensis]
MNIAAFKSTPRLPALGKRRSICCRAGTGFGKAQGRKDASKSSDSGSGIYTAPRTKKRVNLAEELGNIKEEVAPAERGNTDPDRDLTKGNWFELAKLSDFAGDKKRKICELKASWQFLGYPATGSKKTVVLHMFKDTLYAMDAFSTAYQYPLIDAKLEDGPEGPTIETPLDGTVYELKTGKVLKWCPSDGSPVRGFLRTLKASVTPVPLPVYPVVVQRDGRVMRQLRLRWGRPSGDGRSGSCCDRPAGRVMYGHQHDVAANQRYHLGFVGILVSEAGSGAVPSDDVADGAAGSGPPAPVAGALPLQPPGLALGLLVFACMPTTLSSGVALTQVLGGNTALALLLTISTNMASVFTLPFVLPWAMKVATGGKRRVLRGGNGGRRGGREGRVAGVKGRHLQPWAASAPAAAAVLAWGPAEVWSYNWILYRCCSSWFSVFWFPLASEPECAVFCQVSKALSQGVVVAPGALAAAVSSSLVLHAAYLALNATAAQVFQLGGSDPRVAAPTRRAVVVVASQKTLPVAMAVLGRLGPVVGAEAAGCAAVTAVFSHLAQTCVDFWLVSRWLDRIRRRENQLAATRQLGSAATGLDGCATGLDGSSCSGGVRGVNGDDGDGPAAFRLQPGAG